MSAVDKLLKEIEKERNSGKTSYTIKGVKNLTDKDLDNLKQYASFYSKSNGYGLNGFLPYNDNVKEVLRHYGLML